MNTNFRHNRGVASMLRVVTFRRGMAWGVIIVAALAAFEIFNFSTTQFALADVLGTLKFLGIPWATILAIAFCGIDFAGIARLFTPEKGREEPTEVWYLFGAWLLAAGMNAVLTWWGVSVAIVSHSSLAGGSVVASSTLTKVVPVFVAIMVWLIRVLIIGTFSVAGERLFSQADPSASRQPNRPAYQPANRPISRPQPAVAAPFQSVARAPRSEAATARPEATYHNLPMSASSIRKADYGNGPRRS